jgi:exonuclease III
MTTTASKRTNDFQLNTWNVRTLASPGALESLIRELAHYGVNITAIQETKLKNNKTLSLLKHSVYLSNSGNARAPGVGYIVDAKWTAAVIDWNPVSERICVLRVRGKFFNYSLINAYAPHNERPDEEKDDFYSQLDDIYAHCPRRDCKIVIGDLNAKVGREEIFRPTIGKFSMHRETNENGLRLISYAAAHNMEISSTRFRHKASHKITWMSPGSNRGAQIDHILVDKRHATDIMDVRTFHCNDRQIPHHFTDHLLVGARIRARISNVMRQKCSKARRFSSTKTQDKATANDFRKSLELRMNGLGSSGYEWQQLRDAIVEAAKENFGYSEKKETNEWFDEECAEMIEKTKEARIMVGTRSTRKKRSDFNKIQREKTKMFRRKQREFDRRQIKAIEELHHQREPGRCSKEWVRRLVNMSQPHR